MTQQRLEILALIRDRQPIDSPTLAQLLGCSRHTIALHVSRLKRQGYVEHATAKGRPSKPTFAYRITISGRRHLKNPNPKRSGHKQHYVTDSEIRARLAAYAPLHSQHVERQRRMGLSAETIHELGEA